MDFFNGWYAVLSSRELMGNKPLAFRRLGRDLVAWRDLYGKVVVMHDLCPHRSVKLSLGTVKDECIVCPFHGFEFAADGACQLVPETGKGAPNLRCETFVVREEHGLIWLWYGEGEEPEPQIPWFDELNDGFAWSEIRERWPSHVTRCIENQLDYAHLPYVHKSTIGAKFDVAAKDYKFELADLSIKLPMDQGFFEFKFPNIWQLQILPGKFYQFIAFAPVDDKETVMYLRTYQKFVTLPVVRNLAGILMNFQSRMIISQDKRVVLSHPVSPSPLAPAEKLYPSDKGIMHFRKVWGAKALLAHQ